MTPLEYAKLCAKKYEVEKWKLEALVKGNGHAPREVVDRRKPLMALLQVCRICTERTGGVRPFALSSNVLMYRRDLYAAGLNPDSGGEVRCILSKRHWHATVAYFRLTGELPVVDDAIVRRVQGLATRRQNRIARDLAAELSEPAADALLAQSLSGDSL